MRPRARLHDRGRLVPGAALTAALAALAYAAAALVGALASPLVIAMVLGVAVRAAFLRGEALGRLLPGVLLGAGPGLRLGIVALGARLDGRLLLELGPAMLVGSLLGIVAALAAVEIAGRAGRVPPDLRALVGIGTAICGASAIAAAAPVWRARAEHATASIAAISLVGTLGVVAFAAWDAIAAAPPAVFAALAGATLQEVGQVLAAGSVRGSEAADLALLVKLSRVVLLAPVLLASGMLAARASAPTAGAGVGVRRAVPPFVLLFLLVGGAVSAGVVPPPAAEAVASLGSVLTTMAMAAIGIGVDVRDVRGPGFAAIALGALGLVVLVATMVLYYAWILP